MPTLITPELRTSRPFDIKPGKQLTLHATGMQQGDQVVIEVLAMTRAGPAADWCCTTAPAQAAVTEAVPLRCRNGARVILTSVFPWATLNAPQQTALRARVIADDLAQITVDAEETQSSGCDECPCTEPYCASYPLPAGGFAFAEGDLTDPEATVAINPCSGAGPETFVYPTPRPNATAAVYDCNRVIVGYAPNQSHCAIQTGNAVPCNS